MPVPPPDGRIIRFVDIQADRVRLRTAVHGSGRPLLLITGLGASLDLGAPFERELAARGVQTVSFDAPGTGQSTPYAWPRRMPGLARTVERLLDALGYQQVDVLGASLGGVIAQQLARQAPHRVRRLVLAATGPGLGGIPGSPRALLAFATPRRYHQPGHYQRIAARTYGGAARRDPGSPRLPLAAESAGPSLRGYLGQIYAISGWTSLPWLRTLRQQTLVLAGDDDPIVPVANGRILARCIPHARLHIVRRGGHLFLLDSAAEMAGLVAAFLSGDDRRSHPAALCRPARMTRGRQRGTLRR